MGNYSFKTSGLPEPIDGIIEGHNFTQGAPHTAIYTGYTGLTFRNCNLTNCDVPLDAQVISCLRGNVSFCSNIHPEMLDKGYIEQCAIDCPHRTIVDTVMIDGVVIDTNYTYQNSEVT